MKQVLQHVGSRRLEVVEVPAGGVRAGGILVRNAASLISAGTERMVTEFAGKSLLGKARERPDLVRQVLDKVKRDGVKATAQSVMGRLDQPIPLGYSCAGMILEAGEGVTEFVPGQRVACAGMGYASHAETVFVPRNLAVAVPDGVSLEDAAYVTVGAIALQGVRIADVRIGDAVVVIGLGLLGLLTVQILKANGCRVLGVDLDPAKVALARELGADASVARSDDVESAVHGFTGGSGADAILIAAATDSNDPIELAGSIARDRAVVAIVGAVKMDVPRKAYYEKELQLRLSRSYGPGRYDPQYEEKGHDYPIGYVRWTERRNMEEFLRLVGTGQVTPSRLTTHRFSIDRAMEAYTLIGGEANEPFAGVVLTYSGEAPSARARTISLAPRGASGGKLGVGFIGAGNFARSILLPRLSKERVDLVSVVTASGVTAKAVGDKYGFRRCGTDSSDLLGDAAIQAVVIATRHGSHARLVANALRAGKAVLVEKPLALDEAQLTAVLEAHAESDGVLAVGFNRRFAPLAVVLREEFAGLSAVSINYRINAGAIPSTSWIHDPEEGGGRVIGEVCHFVDLVSFLTDDLPHTVFASALAGTEGATGDTLAITLRMRRGSIASITYGATGDKSFSKERIEVMGGGAIAILDDFRELVVSRIGRRRRRKAMVQDKGFDGEIAAFLRAARGEAPLPISVDSLALTTRTTFAMLESIRTGEAVGL